jgi:hypothetical protein
LTRGTTGIGPGSAGGPALQIDGKIETAIAAKIAQGRARLTPCRGQPLAPIEDQPVDIRCGFEQGAQPLIGHHHDLGLGAGLAQGRRQAADAHHIAEGGQPHQQDPPDRREID